MSFLNPRQKQTLAALCDTLFPTLAAEHGEPAQLLEVGAADLNLASALEDTFERLGGASGQRQLKQFLGLIEIGLVNGLMAWRWGAFSRLSLEGRTAVLDRWANSRLARCRAAFQALKRSALFLAYGLMPDGKPNPTWPALQYPGPPGRRTAAPASLATLRITQATRLDCDVLVVGSGAGGGVMAAELAAAGLDVLIVEKGGYVTESAMDGRELESSRTMFEKSGSLTTADLGMTVYAGSTLGGGTTVNWMTSLPPPEAILDEWERAHGFTGATSPAFQASIAAVLDRIHVTTAESELNGCNEVLAAGCQALGYQVDVIPRNARGCQDCSFCNFGCPFGAKQGTLRTYLQDAHGRGARLLVQAQVDRVSHQAGRVTGAEITVRGDGGEAHAVAVRCKAVVVAAGSIHTPAVLLRSGLGNRNIGANLHLHPVVSAVGIYREPRHPWQGPPQTRVSAEFADLDGRGHGVRLETAPAHPGLSALALPWGSGRAHKDLMRQYAHMANIIVITRDLHGGRVALDGAGQPVLHYRLHPYDAQHLQRGLLEALRIHRAAGAVQLVSPHSRPLLHRVDSGARFEAYLDEVRDRGLRGNTFALFSAHQLSSCRIGADRRRGAIQPNGETFEVKNLFVADGSVFPTACGVNPMVSIMATAHYLAQGIKSILT